MKMMFIVTMYKNLKVKIKKHLSNYKKHSNNKLNRFKILKFIFVKEKQNIKNF